MAQIPLRYCSVSDVAEGVEEGSNRRARFSNKEIRALVLTKSFLATSPTEEEQTERILETVNDAIERATKETLSILVKRNDLSLITFETLEQVPQEIRQYVADMAAYFIISLDRSQPAELLAVYERAYRMAIDFFKNHVIISVTAEKVEEIPEGIYNQSQFFTRAEPKGGGAEDYL